MIDIYRFLAFIDNLPDVRFVRDQEMDGLKLSIWDSYVTNKTARIDTTDEEISIGIAREYLKLLGYEHLTESLVPIPIKLDETENVKKDEEA